LKELRENEEGKRNYVLNPVKPHKDDKWKNAAKFGIPIKLTDKVYITAFKCPINEKFNRFYEYDKRLSCKDVIDHYQQEHGMTLNNVFDLTNTNKYYNRKEWGEDVETFKYRSRGKNVPQE